MTYPVPKHSPTMLTIHTFLEVKTDLHGIDLNVITCRIEQMREYSSRQCKNGGTINGGIEELSIEEWRKSLWRNGGTVNGRMEELSMEE